ncbi:MAG: efflux RND transporter periplasmic adaptor subunit [Sedimentibacter saalensis]|jgi:RND family efflux transporter MFP subunit|uniref:RND family efflux transporter MFP subunit n=1 Tax=Sedimentibacter saalensis TaxID=130788 RepID=A0A562JBE6_9FIRM|nr:efflux RND transporter periplasmic adaptor subunit [Sedimentibacter saalensis]MEA5093951.1 efflux RND transporter periplasmic adaptor subunit [Sedimentibacter saalensis]TWH80548.1 RND family efflux transporter MFP subunit [Sedimentibacter saalensis]
MKKIFTRKKIVILLVVLAAVIVVFKMLNNSKTEDVFAANVAPLEKKTIEQIISVKAPLEGIEKADVVSALNYEIIDIKVKEGDIVKKDQVLAVLDSEELEKQIKTEENQIELTYLQQQEKLKSLQLEYDKAVLELENVKDSYESNKALFENDIITEENFKKIETSLVEARKNVEGYNAVNGKVSLSSAEEKQLEIQRQQLEEKKEDLDKIYIKSPIDGTVTRVNVNIGRYAKDTEDEKAMFVVENLQNLQMKVSISEFDIGKIKNGQTVKVYSDILGNEFAEGTVTRISPTAEQKDSNNMERVIPVLIDIVKKPDTLIAGVIASAKINVDKSENVFAVPAGAILQDENEKHKIFILNDDKTVKSVAVEIGLETDLETEIWGEGLQEGMNVVVNPNNTLTDGMAASLNEEHKEDK